MATSVSEAIWSNLFYLYMAIALVVGLLVVGWLVYNMVMFRSRPGRERPRDAPQAGYLSAERGHPVWGYAMALVIAAIMFGLALGTISAVNTIEVPPEDPDRLHLNITGFQFGWKAAYIGEGGVPFEKIGEWTVPVDTPVVANVTSQDVWHNLALPEYRVRIDAIPGEVTHLWFEAFNEETVEPVCVVICGTGHALMKSTMHVVSEEEFAEFLRTESEKAFKALEKRFADGQRGTLVNLTFEAGELQAGNLTQLAAGKPVVVNLTNEAATAVTFTVEGAATAPTATAAPGENARLYFLAPASGAVTIRTAEGATTTLEVVS